MIEDAAVLQGAVGRLQARIRLLVAQQWMCLGLAAAAMVGLLLVAVTRFRWWTDAVDYAGFVLLGGAVLGALLGWTRKITPLVAAQVADERAGLKERLSTAIELTRSGTHSEMAVEQLRDAAHHAAGLRISAVLPWRVPSQWRWAAAGCVVLAAALFLPDLPLFQSAQTRLEREAMKAQGARLHEVAKVVEKKAAEQKKKGEDKNSAILHRIARNMRQLGRDMDRGRVARKNALLQMNDLQKDLKQEQQKPGAGPSPKSMEQVVRDLQAKAQQAGQRGNPEGSKALAQMADAMQNKDFEAAKKQLEELAKKIQSGQMTGEDAARAADALKQMSEATAGSGLDPASKDMKEAAKKLAEAAKVAQQFQQQLQQAKSDAERQQVQQAMQQAVSQAMAQAGEQTQKAAGT